MESLVLSNMQFTLMGIGKFLPMEGIDRLGMAALRNQITRIFCALICVLILPALSACSFRPKPTSQKPGPSSPSEPNSVPTESPIIPSPSPSVSPGPPAPKPPPEALKIDGPKQLTVGQCGIYTVSTVNPAGETSPVTERVYLTLGTPASGVIGAFYLSGSCTGPEATETSLNPGGSSTIFSFRTYVPFNGQLDATARNPFSGPSGPIHLKAGKLGIQFTAGPPSEWVLSGPTSGLTSTCLGPFFAAPRDIYGNPANLLKPYDGTISLPAGATSYSDEFCSQPVSQVHVSQGSGPFRFYVRTQNQEAESYAIVSPLSVRGELIVRTHPACKPVAFKNQLSDTFQLNSKEATTLSSFGTDALGRVYWVGTGYSKKSSSLIIRRSNSGRAGTWSTVDTAQVEAGYDTQGVGFARDGQGNLTVLANARLSTSRKAWTQSIRRSAVGKTVGDSGGWDFAKGGFPYRWQSSAALDTQATSVFWDSLGRWVVRTIGMDLDFSRRLILRIGTPLWENWGTLLNLPPSSGLSQEDFSGLGPSSQSMISDLDGDLWTVLSSQDAKGKYRWMVIEVSSSTGAYKVVDNSDNWPAGLRDQISGARTLTMAPDGTIYVAGYIGPSTGQHEWLVRKTSDQGKTWDTIDQFAPMTVGSGPLSADPAAILVDRSGRIVVAGQAKLTPADQPTAIVRTSVTAAPGSFATEATFTVEKGNYSAATALGQDDLGNIYVGGYGQTKKGQKAFVSFTSCQ
ncbi:MAG: hypothetical protein JNL01_15560 [Bdellovibrionales bacterium]|nr:hypothetical protein [Bdellovibrionales bacterium]